MRCSTNSLMAIVIAAGAVICAAPARSADDKPAALKAPAGAPRPAQSDEPKPIKLTLHPARPPAAALEFALLPRFSEQTSGNAATLYLKAVAIESEGKRRAKFWETLDRWL